MTRNALSPEFIYLCKRVSICVFIRRIAMLLWVHTHLYTQVCTGPIMFRTWPIIYLFAFVLYNLRFVIKKNHMWLNCTLSDFSKPYFYTFWFHRVEMTAVFIDFSLPFQGTIILGHRNVMFCEWRVVMFSILLHVLFMQWLLKVCDSWTSPVAGCLLWRCCQACIAAIFSSCLFLQG